MKACLIPNPDPLHLRINRCGERFKEGVGDIGIDGGSPQANALTPLRAYGSDHVNPLISGLSNGPGTAALSGPQTRQCPLLPKPGFILKPDFEGLAGMFFLNLIHDTGEVFLNSAWAVGSANSCPGRGHRGE